MMLPQVAAVQAAIAHQQVYLLSPLRITQSQLAQVAQDQALEHPQELAEATRSLQLFQAQAVVAVVQEQAPTDFPAVQVVAHVDIPAPVDQEMLVVTLPLKVMQVVRQQLQRTAVQAVVVPVQ
jgi:hypothetical protein